MIKVVEGGGWVYVLEVGEVSGVERKARSLGKQWQYRIGGCCDGKPTEICTM